MSATLNIDTASFARQLAQLRAVTGKSAGSSVRYWSRIMLRKLAHKTPLAKVGRNRGRLRAGWWPSAATIGVSSVYSGSFPNKGEGNCKDMSHVELTPHITMTNTVPYSEAVRNIQALMASGVAEVEARARGEWEKLIAADLRAAGFVL